MIARLSIAAFLVLPLILVPSALGQSWEFRVCAAEDNLPYSNERREGFENEIAEILAAEMEARLEYVWLDSTAQLSRQLLVQQAACDAVMGAVDGTPDLLTTIAYYRTGYVFVYRADAPFEIESFDDPDLEGVSIGIQAGAGGLTPVAYALSNRGLVKNQVTYLIDAPGEDPLGQIVEAVAAGEVDVAVVWGAVAGYFAEHSAQELTLLPVTPQIEPPFVPMVSSIAVGVRSADEALRDDLNEAIVRRWEEIQAVLREYRVPLEPLPRPSLGTGVD